MKRFSTRAIGSGATALLLLLANNCSGSAAEHGVTAAAAPAAWSTASDGARLAALPAARRQALFTSLGSLTFDQFYKVLSRGASDAPVAVDGQVFRGSLANLQKARAAFAHLGSQFPTVGAYFTAHGTTLEAASALQSKLDLAEARLALADFQYSPVLQSDADYCHDKVNSYSDEFLFLDFVAASSRLASLASQLPNTGNGQVEVGTNDLGESLFWEGTASNAHLVIRNGGAAAPVDHDDNGDFAQRCLIATPATPTR